MAHRIMVAEAAAAMAVVTAMATADIVTVDGSRHGREIPSLRSDGRMSGGIRPFSCSQGETRGCDEKKKHGGGLGHWRGKKKMRCAEAGVDVGKQMLGRREKLLV